MSSHAHSPGLALSILLPHRWRRGLHSFAGCGCGGIGSKRLAFDCAPGASFSRIKSRKKWGTHKWPKETLTRTSKEFMLRVEIVDLRFRNSRPGRRTCSVPDISGPASVGPTLVFP